MAAVSPTDLAAHPWVAREPGSGTRAVFEQSLALAGLAAPQAHLVIAGALPVSARRAIGQSALWSALPAVRAGRVSYLPDQMPFGGAPSGLRFASHLVTALEAA